MWLFGLFFALVGAILVVAGQRIFWTRQLARMRGQKIQGKIIKWKSVRARGMRDSSATSVMYSPEVAFVDPNGEERKAVLTYQYTPLFRDQNPARLFYRSIV